MPRVLFAAFAAAALAAAAVPSDASMFLGLPGRRCDSQPGYCIITDLDQCEAAAVDLAMGDHTAGVIAGEGNAKRVGGCYVSSTGNLKLNLAFGSRAAAGGDTALCVACDETSPRPFDESDFLAVEGGRCENAPGFCAIRDEPTCEVAADLLGYPDTRAGVIAGGNANRVGGCFVAGSNGNLKLNPAWSSTAAVGDDTTLCARCDNEADYRAFVNEGQCEDEDGYCAIMTEEQCEEGAAFAALSDTTARRLPGQGNLKRVRGCYATADGVLKWNPALASGAAAREGETNVCVRCDLGADHSAIGGGGGTGLDGVLGEDYDFPIYIPHCPAYTCNTFAPASPAFKCWDGSEGGPYCSPWLCGWLIRGCPTEPTECQCGAACTMTDGATQGECDDHGRCLLFDEAPECTSTTSSTSSTSTTYYFNYAYNNNYYYYDNYYYFFSYVYGYNYYAGHGYSSDGVDLPYESYDGSTGIN